MSDNQSQTSPLSPAVSPLLEADPNSLNELIAERIDEIFNINPKAKDSNGNYQLTDAHLNEMVTYLLTASAPCAPIPQQGLKALPSEPSHSKMLT